MRPYEFFRLIVGAQPELAAEIRYLTFAESRSILNKATGLDLHGASGIDAGLDAYWAAIEAQSTHSA